MASHVVRSRGKEKRRPDAVFIQHAAEIRDTVARSAVGVNIDSKRNLHFVVNSPDSTACRRKKSSVILMESLNLTCGSQSQYFFAFLMLGFLCWTS